MRKTDRVDYPLEKNKTKPWKPLEPINKKKKGAKSETAN